MRVNSQSFCPSYCCEKSWFQHDGVRRCLPTAAKSLNASAEKRFSERRYNPKSSVQRKHQHGISLVEIMVCALLLTIGLLGAVSGHVGGLKSSQNSYFHAQAEILAKDMVERIRANREAALSGLYNGVDTNALAATEFPACRDSASGCDQTQQVLVDQIEWSRNFSSALVNSVAQPLLPDGRGVIQSNGNDFEITISWLAPEMRTGPDEIVVEFTL